MSSGVWDLWLETAKEVEALGDPLFLECLEAASAGRIFDDLPDDKLKATLSLINSLLNDPKTRAKGLTLLNDLSSQINPSRLITYQDAVISALHLVLKGLDSPLASAVLTNILPKCHSMSEVNQMVTSTVVPKILSTFCAEDGANAKGKEGTIYKSLEELTLLKTCLLEYHGPCGQFRDKLERVLVQLIDNENGEYVEFLGGTMPLLSFSGGGGNAGEKHTKDWSAMFTKFLRSTYATVQQLYGDSSSAVELENPFDGELLPGFKKIVESQVLVRMSLLKRRLLNLLTITSGYLRCPFPAPKHIPQKGVLKMLEVVSSVNPALFDKSNAMISRKETTFLAAILPGIHTVACSLLQSLFYCVGSNILIDGIAVEQLLASEFKWIQQRPNSYEKLKLNLYETLITWLNMTGGIVTNVKTLSIWVNTIGDDTSVEKDVVELKMLSKPKTGKSMKTKSASLSLSINPSSITATSTQTYVQKSSDVCQMALRALISLIPSVDADNHKKIYHHLLKSVSILTQYNVSPSPYDSPLCRVLVFEALVRLAYSPQPRSPMSLSLLIALLRQGLQDSAKLVTSFCATQISNMERLMHPSCAALALAGPPPAPILLDSSNCNTKCADLEESLSLSDESMDEEIQGVEQSKGVAAWSKSASQETLPIDVSALELIIKRSIESILKTAPAPVTSTSLLSSEITRKPKKLIRSAHVLSSASIASLNETEAPEVEDLVADDMNDGKANGRSQNLQHQSVQSVNSNGNYTPEKSNTIASDEDDDESGLHIVNEDNENATVDSGNDKDTSAKRKATDLKTSPADEVLNIEMQAKRVKTASPVKSPPATVADGPSVQDMLTAFVESEPVV